MCPGWTLNGWSRRPELNRRPDVFSIRTLLLIRPAVTCALHHRLARYSAGFVSQVVPKFWGDPLEWHSFFGPLVLVVWGEENAGLGAFSTLRLPGILVRSPRGARTKPSTLRLKRLVPRRRRPRNRRNRRSSVTRRIGTTLFLMRLRGVPFRNERGPLAWPCHRT